LAFQSGDYLLQVEMEGTPIQGSPFKLPVRAARADAAASVLVPPISADSEGSGGDTGLSPRVMLGSDGRARFTVQARDKFGHNHTQGGQKVVANLMIRCEVEDNGDGTYSISYVPSSDPHQQMFLDISLDGRQLGGMYILRIPHIPLKSTTNQQQLVVMRSHNIELTNHQIINN
jgi:hypothetical protein